MSDFDWDDLKQKLAAGIPTPVAALDSGDDDADSTPTPTPTITAPTSLNAQVSDDDNSDSSSVNPVLKAYLDDKAELAQAQQQAAQNRLGSGLTGALAQFTHGLSRAPGQADLSGAEALAKNDNTPVQNVMAQQKVGDQIAGAQRSDDIADSLRDVYKPIFKKAGLDPGSLDGLSADEIKSYAQNPLEFIDRQEQRRQADQLRADAVNARVQAGLDKSVNANTAKSAQFNDKMALALKSDLDPNGGRAGNMGQNQKRVDAATRLEGLLSQTGGNPDQRQMEELAIGAQNMLSNGNGSAEQVKSLIPSSAWGNAKKMYEWFSNNPTGTDQQAFVARMGDTIQREKQIAGDQVKTAQVQRLAAHQALKDANPEVYGSILQSYGIDPGNIKNGRYESPVARSGGTHPEANDALQWAKNNPNDPRSAKILQRLGIGSQGGLQ